MATTIGPDVMMDGHRRESVVSAASPHLSIPAAMDTLATRTSPLPTPQASPRPTAPPPNPPFVFPARQGVTTASGVGAGAGLGVGLGAGTRAGSSSAPSSLSRASGRRPKSLLDTPDNLPLLAPTDTERRRRSPALPDFSFNPGASLAPTTPPSNNGPFLSPPQSPATPLGVASRPGGHGHRRGGSEFVGGNLRDGDFITVMGLSPTKSESGMPSPSLAPSQPVRRGHAHRRSAAISSHDLSSIILPSHVRRGSSAPSSPSTNPHRTDFLFVETKDRPAQSEPSLSPVTDITPGGSSSSNDGNARLEGEPTQQVAKTESRTRVGFSEKLEFIPRPLSLVSSDTSSTMTIRPGGHSVSGSISSVISLGPSGGDAHSSVAGRSPTRKPPLQRRPSTAGAVLERTPSEANPEAEDDPQSPRRRGSIPTFVIGSAALLREPLGPPTPSPTKTPKRWSFFGLESLAPAVSPTRARPLSTSFLEAASKEVRSAPSSTDDVVGPSAAAPEPTAIGSKSEGKKRIIKKPKKVKTWAGSILSRKAKGRKPKRRAPTPPPIRTSMIEDEDVEWAADDMAPEPELTPPALMVTETLNGDSGDEYSQPRPLSVPDEESLAPMIDLDAALGPFNTPLPRNPEWEAAQAAGGLGGGSVKKQLHSAAGMSRFSGPGMHYSHRRAESAPEMVPFEAARRFGSSSTMADVFEEEEEEDEDEDPSSAVKATGKSALKAGPAATRGNREGVRPVTGSFDFNTSILANSQSSSAATAAAGQKRKCSDFSDTEKQQHLGSRVKSEHAAGSGLLQDDIIVEEPMHELASDSDQESAASNPSPRSKGRTRILAPVEVGPPSASLTPVSPYSSMTQSSSFPSPRSPMSYDANRISTAPSSVITEENFQSLLLGEPGPEVRVSVEIPPSLASTASTTRDGVVFSPNPFGPPTQDQNPQARRPSAAHFDQPRPASFGGAGIIFGRRRSSLASLSRLINTSHGERSKLSMEVPLENDEDKKQANKAGKKHRLSRMMQFWKPKESSSNSNNNMPPA